IGALALDPNRPETLYAAAGEKAHPGLFMSKDSGENWTRIADLPERAMRLWVEPQSEDLYVAGAHSIVHKSGSATIVSKAPDGVSFNDVSAGFSAEHLTIYATSPRGAFISTDAGKQWQKATLPGSGAHVRAVATSRNHSAVAYVSFDRLSLEGKT